MNVVVYEVSSYTSKVYNNICYVTMMSTKVHTSDFIFSDGMLLLICSCYMICYITHYLNLVIYFYQHLSILCNSAKECLELLFLSKPFFNPLQLKTQNVDTKTIYIVNRFSTLSKSDLKTPMFILVSKKISILLMSKAFFCDNIFSSLLIEESSYQASKSMIFFSTILTFVHIQSLHSLKHPKC